MLGGDNWAKELEKWSETVESKTGGFLTPIRACHDCGRPTPDYRCPECWRKLRLKAGLDAQSSEEGVASHAIDLPGHPTETWLN